MHIIGTSLLSRQYEVFITEHGAPAAADEVRGLPI